jgi:cytochrome P450
MLDPLNVSPKHDVLSFDPRDGSLFVDRRREAVFARLREGDALYVDSNGHVPIYSLVRYADVERAYKEADVFSPCAGLTLDSFDPANADSLSGMLETAPPDRHRALRNAMQGGFRGGGLAEVGSEIEDRVDRLLASIAAEEPIEFVERFARGAATAMMSSLLGLSAEAEERLAPALRAIGEVDFGESAESLSGRQRTELMLLRGLTRAVRAQRESEPSNGLIGLLAGAEIDGQPLSDHEVALNCFNVAMAGTGASQHTLAGAAAVWAEHPTVTARAVEDPKRRRRLVDETLRWLSPVIHLTRILTADVEISGQRLPKGAGVCLWNFSANRDESVFEEPSAFDPDRPPTRSLAFGAGPQYCLGAEVVRTQLEALLSGMARNQARFELAEPPRWMRSNAIAGVESLSLQVRR